MIFENKDINELREQRHKIRSEKEVKKRVNHRKTRDLSSSSIENLGVIRMVNDELIPTWTKIELAEALKVNPRTLYKWVSKGIFPGPKYIALSAKAGTDFYRHKTTVYMYEEVQIIHECMLNFFNDRSTLSCHNSEIISLISERIGEFRRTYGE